MRRILVWGTGGMAENILPQLAQKDMLIEAFVDSDPARQGFFHGKPVLAPEAVAKLTAGREYDLIVIASCYHREIRDQVRELGISEPLCVPSSFFHFSDCTNRMTDEQFMTLISVPWWYHSFEILPGVTTPGVCSYKPHLLEHPMAQKLSGMRVLDIGAWDGAYTLEMERRGANVTAFDIQPPTHSGFSTTCTLNGLSARHIRANVYDLNPQEHGTYDLVTFFGVYYHLKNPLTALANINAVLETGGTLLVEGAILEGAPTVDGWWAGRSDTIDMLRDIPVAHYVKGEYEGHWSNWWVPNLTCLRHWLESSGFEVLEYGLVERNTRAFLVARKVDDLPMEHGVLGSPSPSPGK